MACKENVMFSCPRSRLRIRSRETGSAVFPLRVSPLVLQTRGDLSPSPCAGRPGSSEVPRNPPTRWDVSSIPANGIFLPKKNAQRVEND